MVVLNPVSHKIQTMHRDVQHLISKSTPWAGAGPRGARVIYQKVEFSNLSEGGVFRGENFVATGVGQVGANMWSPMFVSMESVTEAWYLSGDSFALEEAAFFSWQTTSDFAVGAWPDMADGKHNRLFRHNQVHPKRKIKKVQKIKLEQETYAKWLIFRIWDNEEYYAYEYLQTTRAKEKLKIFKRSL